MRQAPWPAVELAGAIFLGQLLLTQLILLIQQIIRVLVTLLQIGLQLLESLLLQLLLLRNVLLNLIDHLLVPLTLLLGVLEVLL